MLIYQDWTVEDWKKVMFSDESHFELRFGNQADHVRRPVGSNRFSDEFTVKTVKHPQKVMVWASFSFNGRGAIKFLKPVEMMNRVKYRGILNEKLKFFMKLHKCTHFLQDLAPCHKAKIVKKWFEDHPNIQLVKWPGNSPDLNPIENMWIFMKNRLKESLLKYFIGIFWYKIDKNYLSVYHIYSKIFGILFVSSSHVGKRYGKNCSFF